MSKLAWDEVGERFYETGTDKGVLYPQVGATYPKGYAWNGLTGVTEQPSGAEVTSLYADNAKYLNMISAEELGITIEAYMSPEEFDECDGSATLVDGVTAGQQSRKSFGFCFRTKIGNDSDGDDFGYKLHLVYGCMAQPSEKAYKTVNNSPEAMTLSWTVKTTPVPVIIDGKEFKPSALIIIDSTKFVSSEAKAKLAALEEKLYGTEEAEAYLPLPAEVYSTLK